MKKNRLVALVMASVMALSLLTGCGGSSSSGSASAGSTADYSADEDYSNLSVKVGMTVSASFGSFTPYAGIAYINDVDRSAAEVTATGRRNSITGESALPGRDALQLKVGANWQLTETLDVNAGYTAEIRNKATEHNANVGIGLTF